MNKSAYIKARCSNRVVIIEEEDRTNLSTTEMLDMFESLWIGLTFSKKQFYEALKNRIEEFEYEQNKNK